jgi:hypothetical protein
VLGVIFFGPVYYSFQQTFHLNNTGLILLTTFHLIMLNFSESQNLQFWFSDVLRRTSGSGHQQFLKNGGSHEEPATNKTFRVASLTQFFEFF